MFMVLSAAGPVACRPIAYHGFACLPGGTTNAGVDIALFEILKERLLDEAERTGGPPPHFALLGAGMVSSSVAQVSPNGDSEVHQIKQWELLLSL
jgi:hypothetical protein